MASAIPVNMTTPQFEPPPPEHWKLNTEICFHTCDTLGRQGLQRNLRRQTPITILRGKKTVHPTGSDLAAW
jgi:hypothetical protein